MKTKLVSQEMLQIVLRFKFDCFKGQHIADKL